MTAHAAQADLLSRWENALGSVLRGKPEAVRLALVTLLARGHLLIEDVPGVGKTTLAHALARSVRGQFQRVQFTSDLLPSDVLGTSIFNARTQAFEFRPGPVFTNFLVADEINRATPKTQSALLEAMNEGQVTVDGQTMPLALPFLVVATQNPVEHHGTFPLPESQLDRFLVRLRIGYPDRAAERDILRNGASESAPAIHGLLGMDDVLRLQEEVRQVTVDTALLDYLLTIVERTRTADSFALGVSPRGAQALYHAAQAHALLNGRQFVTPEDIKLLVLPVCAHRVVASARANAVADGRAWAHNERLLRDILAQVPVPL